MGQFWLRALTALVLCALALKCTRALQVEFYSEKNYLGYADGVQKKPGHDMDCYTLDQQLEIKSIKTDKCLILYTKPDCKKQTAEDVMSGCEADGNCYLYSYRIEKDTWEFPYFQPHRNPYYYWINYRKVQSFHVCSQERGGGPALDVDYYSQWYHGGNLLRQWRDVCTCQNIPENIRRGKGKHFASMDNHGNDMKVFSEENCRGESQFLPAGDNEASWRVTNLEIATRFNVASFQPIGLNDCIKLNAQIVRFYFKNGTSEQPIPSKVKLPTSGQIINDWGAETTQQYTLSESVSETVEFSIAPGYTKMNTVKVSPSVIVTGEVGVPLVTEAEVSEKISANYQYQKRSSNTTTGTVTKTTTVQATQTVAIPGCHNCTVDAYVKQIQDFPIDYESYSQISRYAGSTRMSAVDIKANLPAGVDYVKDVDEFTVEAKIEGRMYAQYGLETLMETQCDRIPDCTFNGVQRGSSALHYEILREETENRGWKSNEQGTNEIGTFMGNHNWNTLFEFSLGV